MDYTKVKYSEAEIRLRGLIPKKPKMISSKELVAKYYDGTASMPFNAQKIVMAMVYGIVKKATYNKEKWKICRSKPAGPRASELWIEEHVRKQA